MPYLHGLVFILATPIELVTNFIVDRGFVCNQGIKDLVADWLPWQGEVTAARGRFAGAPWPGP